jgi:hypothetical protein
VQALRTAIRNFATHLVTPIPSFILLAAMMLLFLTPIASAATGNITQLAYTTHPQNILPNTTSAMFSVQTRNSSDTPESLTTSSNPLHITSSSGTGEFSQNGTTGWGAGSFTMNSGTANKNFYYRDSSEGTFILTATLTNGADTTQTWVTTQQITIVDTTTPSTPTNGAPNESLVHTQSVTFQWQHATDNISPQTSLTYEFQSSADNTAVAGVLVGVTPEAVHTNIIDRLGYNDGTIYYWQVRAIDEQNNKSNWSTIWSFTVDRTAPRATITNNGTTIAGDTVQPNIVTEDTEKALLYNWVADANNPEALDFITSARKPIFAPTTAGSYTFYLTICDTFGNCTNPAITFRFTWRPNPIPVISTTAAATPVNPAGLVITQFNTTNPTALGITTVGSSAQTSSATAPVDDQVTDTDTPARIALTSSSSSDRIWWILLSLALLAAAYYAYRNWQLSRAKN